MPHRSLPRSLHVVLILLLAAVLLSLAACGSGGGTSAEPNAVAPDASITVAEPSDAATATDSQAIPWDEASSHIGETVTIEGKVVAGFYADTSNGEPTFLNIGRDYPNPDRFTVVIWGDDRGSFPDAPESMYDGKTIRVTGDVSEYEGGAEIEVTSPDAIEVVD